jgi:hypothetical protein
MSEITPEQKATLTRFKRSAKTVAAMLSHQMISLRMLASRNAAAHAVLKMAPGMIAENRSLAVKAEAMLAMGSCSDKEWHELRDRQALLAAKTEALRDEMERS